LKRAIGHLCKHREKNSMIKNESSVEISKPVSEVFAFVEDFSSAPRWLTGCIELRREGEPKSGTPVHYKFKQGPSAKALDGVLTTYERERRLTLSFVDQVFEIVVDLAFSPTAKGTRVDHSIAIEPKRFLAKLMAPLMRGGNRKQVEQNLARLSELLSGPRHAGPASA
jgi:carbon monoxide dehydrogenase subunit G